MTGLVMGSSGTTSAAPAPAGVELAAQSSATWLNPVAPKFKESKDKKIPATKQG